MIYLHDIFRYIFKYENIHFMVLSHYLRICPNTSLTHHPCSKCCVLIQVIITIKTIHKFIHNYQRQSKVVIKVHNCTFLIQGYGVFLLLRKILLDILLVSIAVFLTLLHHNEFWVVCKGDYLRLMIHRSIRYSLFSYMLFAQLSVTDEIPLFHHLAWCSEEAAEESYLWRRAKRIAYTVYADVSAA